MKIVRISVTELPARNAGTWLENDRIASPLSMYPEYATSRKTWMGLQEQIVVRVETEDGTIGYGLTRGGKSTKAIIVEHLGPFLLGKDPTDRVRLYDQMIRVTLPYGQGSLAMFAISALDLALWDLTSKLAGLPLYVLLGGKVRDQLPVYVTVNDPSYLGDTKFSGYKLAMPYGPADGEQGIKGNIELVARMRKAVGFECGLSIDCFSAWDVPYTQKMAQELQPFRIEWFEDPLLPYDREGYLKLRHCSPGIQIALGNFEFAERGFLELVKLGIADILQPDLTWAGGITGGMRLATLASLFGIQLSLHNGGMYPWAIHLMTALPGSSSAEFVLTHPISQAGKSLPLFPSIPFPLLGCISHPTGSGASAEIPDFILESGKTIAIM